VSAAPVGASVLAFGVEPSDRRYRLRLARYPALAGVLAAEAASARFAARPMDVLDVGCGRGRTLRYLEAQPDALRRVRLTGIDLDPRLPERLHGRERWRAALADASRGLPFRDGAFDVVVCEQVLEHLHGPERLVAEAARVLRPGGLFVAGVPTFPPGIAALRGLFSHRHDDATHGHGHVSAFSALSFRRLVGRSGAFRVASVRGFRSMSGGVLAPLEDHRWWWRMNGALFGALPWFAAEVQLTARRADSPSPTPAKP
jgi:SAM-dependent methyltransferase